MHPSLPKLVLPTMDFPDLGTYVLLAAATYGLLQGFYNILSLASRITKPTQGTARQAPTEEATINNERPPQHRRSTVDKITVTRTRLAHYENIGCGALASASSDECTTYAICKNCQKQVKKFK